MNKYKVIPSDKLGIRFRETKKRVDIVQPALDAGGKNEFALNLGITDFVEDNNM